MDIENKRVGTVVPFKVSDDYGHTVRGKGKVGISDYDGSKIILVTREDHRRLKKLKGYLH